MSEELTWDTPEKVQALCKLNKDAVAEEKIDAIFLNDVTIKRFLRARRGNIAAATRLLLRHQRYRVEICKEWWPHHNVPLEHIRPAINSGKIYIHGVDKGNRPVCWIRGGLHDKYEDRLELTRFITWFSDELNMRLDQSGNVDQFVAVVDMGAFGYANFDVDAAQKNY